jgi:hypothetical protein
MAFNLTPEERQKVCDAWKPSYTDAQYKEFCYLLETAEDKSVRTELGPLERYSPENLYEYISEARFLTAVQCVVSDFAQDSHRGRKEGPEYTTPDFWENIRELGYPSQFFWTDLQVIISDLQRTAWKTVARIYDINDKPTPEEEERYKQLRETLAKHRERAQQTQVPSKAEIDALIRRSKEQNEATAELILQHDVTDPVLYKKPSLWKRLFCR